MDSLGVGPFLKAHVKFVNKHLIDGDELIFNKRPLQHHSSDTCGFYAINFVLHMAGGGKFDNFIKSFGLDLKANDNKVRQLNPSASSIKGGGQFSRAIVHSK
jgi:hypothetical protein